MFARLTLYLHRTRFFYSSIYNFNFKSSYAGFVIFII